MPGFSCFINIPVIRCYDILSSIVKKMTHLYRLNSRFYDNCDKKIIIIKEKDEERRG